MFIAIKALKQDIDELYALSPSLMEWSEGVYVIDLGPCLSYWQTRAERFGGSVEDYFQNFFQKNYKETQVAYAPHPWQAVLLLSMMQERGLVGFLGFLNPYGSSIKPSLGQTLYQQMSWQVWWQGVFELSKHLAKIGLSKASHAQLKKDQRRMQECCQRMNWQTPRDLFGLPLHSLRRRFGAKLTQFWEWAFPDQPGAHLGWLTRFDDFPFILRPLHEPIVYKREFDEPIDDWEHLEPYFKEDLNQLCKIPFYQKGMLVLCLEWRFVFDDLSDYKTTIPFRYPHDLHLEIPHHPTTLLQAYHHYMTLCRQQTAKAHEVDLPPPKLFSWELEITKMIPKNNRLLELFSDGGGVQDELQKLENRLRVPLKAYQLVDDLYPEHAFTHKPGLDQKIFPDDCGTIIHHARPMFIFHKPKPFEAKGTSSLRVFLERTLDKWWLHKEQNFGRDYYLLINHAGEQIWVYQDLKGQWFEHGIFA